VESKGSTGMLHWIKHSKYKDKLAVSHGGNEMAPFRFLFFPRFVF
jgi:hypothetical protein